MTKVMIIGTGGVVCNVKACSVLDVLFGDSYLKHTEVLGNVGLIGIERFVHEARV